MIFTGILLVQSSYILPFSLKEGFSSITVLAFGVAAAPIVLLWTVFFIFRRSGFGIRVHLLVGIIICLLFEILLPVSPFKTTISSMRVQKVVDSVIISDVADELFRSHQGNPIGIRISFNAAFPQGGIVSVSPTIWALEDRYHHYQTGMSHFANIAVEPVPERNPDFEYIFAKGQAYTFTADFLPGFLYIPNGDNELCLYEKESRTLSLEQFREIISEPVGSGYSVEIKISGNSYFVSPRTAYSGTTDQTYSLKMFYESAMIQGAGSCAF